MTEALTIVETPGSHLRSQQSDSSPGILLHKFVKANAWRGGPTTDPNGQSLPDDGSPWIYEKPVLVSAGDRRAGVTSGQIMKAIADQGYIVLAIADDV